MIQGLTEAEALARRQRGQGNNVRLATSRSYGDILRQNVFNFINIVLFAIGVLLFAVGRRSDATTSVILIGLNTIVGTVQEMRAKRQLDHIALLNRPRVTLLREGRERSVDPAEIVLGDVLVARPGDQIVVDGEVIGEGEMEVDESLLTGESDLIRKRTADRVLSGSFCVTGSGMYEAHKVGAESYANQLTAEARAFRVVQTPLQRDVDFLIRLLTLTAGFIALLLGISAVVYAIPLVRSVQMAAVIAGLIPNGLFFMVIVAYALGSLRIVQRGALVQQANAVESLSNVTMLCMDKTGTLTTNQIQFRDAMPVGLDREALLRIAGDYAHSVSVNNRTGEALVAALPGQARAPVDEVPFSSERKWSALSFDEDGLRGAYILGAPEMLRPALERGVDLAAPIAELAAAGLRVLLLAHHPREVRLHDAKGEPSLPHGLRPLGLLSFTDELRPSLQETLAGFASAGITLKIISGDNPQTVAALARQAGLPVDAAAIISGTDLSRMNEDLFAQAAEKGVIFGRITPAQKEQLVDVLRRRGHYVAMIGDGVNDVLSLKRADLGIAMQSGSAATRGVADMVLLGDSFAALPPAFLEGQRIVNGMKDIFRLFITRALYFALLIIATAVIRSGFPYAPKHNTLLTLFTVGIPAFALATWARPAPTPRGGILRAVLRFILPAALVTFLFGLFIYMLAFGLAYARVQATPWTPEEIRNLLDALGIDYAVTTTEAFATEVAIRVAQTALTLFTLLAGLGLIVFAEPPTRFFVAGDAYSGDRRPAVLALLLLLASVAVVLIPGLRTFFELLTLPTYAYAIIVATAIVWFLVLRAAWRGKWLERFLRLNLEE